ncbi:MAG: M28 family peptidase [Candidatus Solibacter usitatus]|nr:M28 family peptidase [Candidatus Solibacter usitatus]
MRIRLAVLACAGAALLPGQMHLIEGARIGAHVKFLASDLMEGRGVGARGGQLATGYLAAQFASAGLAPGAEDGSYLQKVPLRMVEMAPGAQLTASAGGKSVTLHWLEDFAGTSHRQESAVALDAEAVFVGHGIRAPEFNWDDYKGVDVRGKVVVMFTNEPPSGDARFFKGRALTYYGRWTYKYEEAARQGAVAALIIHTAPTASYGWPVVRSSNGRPSVQVRRKPDEPALEFAGWVTAEAGGRILALAGKKLDELLKAADSRDFRAAPLGRVRVRARFGFKLADIETHNVVGVVRGSGSTLSNEAVVFSAHWDHLGVGEAVKGDSIYNGAVDNATGCGMLIEMARAWASMQPKPLRSAYFVAVTAEESGLLGSKYFADHPPLAPDQIAANLNFDSYSPYGRVKDTVLTGAERTSFFPLVENVAQRHQLAITPDGRPESGSYFRSDHYSFARLGIPAFSVNMGSPARAQEYAARYHQPSDAFSGDWDFSGMEQFARFGFVLGVEIANLEKIPARVDAR